MTDRHSTPPLPAGSVEHRNAASSLTPEQVRTLEINRLKAKALREQQDARNRQEKSKQPATSQHASSNNLAAGQKRSFSAATLSNLPAISRDGRNAKAAQQQGNLRPLDEIRPARNFAKFVEYDFSKMTDTKGGFLSLEDDPHNKALHTLRPEEKPAHMTMKEWERHQLLRSLREQKAGPFEPGLSVLKKEDNKLCRECGTMEIDWKWEEILGCAVCNTCKDKFPEKYSLLTKTEAKEDYLLTDPELRDEELLPHLERPNPHKSTWNNMMLFLRYQVEEYAFSDKKWGSAEALDEEFHRRENDKKRRKEDKFRTKLQELKKRTRVEAYRRNRQGGSASHFGDELDKSGKHTHTWGRPADNEDGAVVKQCVECGMEVEELEF